MKVFFLADQFAIMVQPRVVAKLRKWIQSLKKKKKKNLTWKKKIYSPKKTTNSIPKPSKDNIGIKRFGIISILFCLILWITKRTRENFFPSLACDKLRKFQYVITVLRFTKCMPFTCISFFLKCSCGSWQLIKDPCQPELGLPVLGTSCSYLSEWSCHRCGPARLQGGWIREKGCLVRLPNLLCWLLFWHLEL